MLKTQFKDQLEFDSYITEQKLRMEKGYLTRSEREQLNKMLVNDYKPTFEIIKKIPILVTNLLELNKPCQDVTKEDNIDEIVEKLKNTLLQLNGYGLSANQIGINKKISYIKHPKKFNMQFKKWEYEEIILINPKIIECDKLIQVKGEQCLSLPGLAVNTARYIFITVINHDKNLNEKLFSSQDLEGLIIQHESDHTIGKTILDRRWRSR